MLNIYIYIYITKIISSFGARFKITPKFKITNYLSVFFFFKQYILRAFRGGVGDLATKW